MKLGNAAAASAALGMALAGGSALANGDAEQCFDKGTLTYFDCPTAEEATGKYYVGARGGYAAVDELDDYYELGDLEDGYVFSGFLGYDAIALGEGVGLRPELEIGFLQADSEWGSYAHTNTTFAFANLFVDYALAESIDLIVGGGIGLGDVEVDYTPGSDADTVFGYNIGAGVGVEVVEDWTVEAMYRYMAFEGAEVFGDEADINAHTGTVGLRVEF